MTDLGELGVGLVDGVRRGVDGVRQLLLQHPVGLGRLTNPVWFHKGSKVIWYI